MDIDLVSPRRLSTIRIRHNNDLHRIHVHHRLIRHIFGLCIGVSRLLTIPDGRRDNSCWGSDLSIYRCSVYTDDLGLDQCGYGCYTYVLYIYGPKIRSFSKHTAGAG